jgi:galactose mutarotase-like enzyme
MITKLENDLLKIEVKHHGAELSSLIDKSTRMEYIWQADPTFWGRHAPVLFPIVGRLKNNSFLVGTDEYQMKQHGFARNMDFELIFRNKAGITFELKSSPATLAQYPFPFRLRIQYVLYKNVLMVAYEVYNPSDAPIYFSIGGHPAFRCPLFDDEKRSDYQLVFERNEYVGTKRLTDGIRTGKELLILENGNDIGIRDFLFDNDALVFENLESDWVRLQKGERPILTFNFKGFPYLGIWSKNQTSPFVCIEPWYGLADRQDHNQQLAEKEGIMKLDPKNKFECIYSVAIHDLY